MSDDSSEVPEVYEDFIIGTDPDGNPVKFTCDHTRLRNAFGANTGAPLYLTPVFFRREVLQRYYADPRTYKVEDGQLSKGYEWSVAIDNDRRDCVMVFLGDLGRDLPPEERQHWIRFNTPPVPAGDAFSNVAFRRSMLAEPADATSPHLRFKAEWQRFRAVWTSRFKWDMFRSDVEAAQLGEAALHIPMAEDRAEFDEQVSALANILIGSLNVAELVSKAAPPLRPAAGPVQALEGALSKMGIHAGEHLQFLRELEALNGGRRRTKDYRNAAAACGLPGQGYDEAFIVLLERAIALLDFLRRLCLAHELPQSDPAARCPRPLSDIN